MKITIIGKGNAGVLTALHYYYHSQFSNQKVEIELIHDKKIPSLTVGQATTVELPFFLWTALGTDFYNNQKELKSTLKTGILYEDWGKKNKEIFHCFSFGSYAIHYDTHRVQDYILKKGLFKVKIIDENIIDYNKIDSDIIFDCRGWPKNFTNYETLTNPLNAVICSNLNIKKSDLDIHWTRAVATPDGWCFYIPLHNTVSVGYMYNSKITDKKSAEKNFKKMFNINHLREEFPFKQYIAKNPIIDERIVLNGNMLFFLEPLESTSVATYIEWIRLTYDWLILKRRTSIEISNIIKNYTKQIQNFILWHYNFGSKYNTPFWKYAKKLSNNIEKTDIEFKDILNYSKDTDYSKIREIPFDRNNYRYAQWQPWSIKLWYDGVTKKM